MSQNVPRFLKRGVAGALIAGLASGGLVALGAAAPAYAADATITLDSDGAQGTPQQYGSGWIYGLTENGQLPDRSLLEQVGFNYNRAGGAQLDQGGGWRGGTYDRRWAATVAQYKTVESLGGRFVLLPHDLYGIDGVGGVGAAVPGNNGDWSDYDRFLDRLISDVKANNMQVDWDIWNEPDYPVFWPEPRTNQARFEQYLEMWRRTYVKLQAELPDAVIVGPSTNEGPDERDAWWRGYLDFVQANNVVPDIISWHEIEGRYNGHDPVASKQALQAMLDRRGITKQIEFQVNEYAAPHQQYPAISAWYISRLERSDIHGLRSHWGSAQNLHNDAAQLLYHEGTRYFTRGEFQTYAKYNSQQGTVIPVETTTRNVDAFATRSADDDTLTALIGSYNTTGTVDVVAERGGPVQPGADVRVVVETIIEGDGRENRGANLVSDTRATVGADGRLVTPVQLQNSRDAYFVTIKAADEVSALDGRLTFGANLGGLRGGQTATVDTVYRNYGDAAQNGVILDLVLPAGWSATTARQELGSVAAGEEKTVSWQITVPAGEVSKRRVVETRASWQQAGADLSSNVWAAYSVPCTIAFQCEFEEGSFTGGFLERNHDGYTGQGFIGGMLGQGARASLPFSIDTAGNYVAKIRYAAGPDGPHAQVNRTMTLTIGDQTRRVEFPRTSTWAAWREVSVPVTLPAGVAEFALAANAGDTAWVNLDNVTITAGSTTPTDPEPEPEPEPGPEECSVGVLCEAEDGVRGGGANLATNHAGFTGTGFVDGLVSPGASLTQTVKVGAAGSYGLTLRYAAGPDGPSAAIDRTMSIVVDGQTTQVTLPKTSTWGAWATVTTPVTLPVGTSTVQVRVNQGDTGWANIDSLRFDARSATVTPSITSATPGESGWQRAVTSLALAVDNAEASIEYRIDGGGWTTYSQPVQFVRDGRSTVEYRAVIGGTATSGTSGSVEVLVDRTAPSTTVTTNPATGTAVEGAPVTATFATVDPASGVAKTEYSVDGGEWIAATAEGVTFTDRGRYSVAYRSVDVAGNVETAKTIVLTVAPRATTAGVRITSADQVNDAGWYSQAVVVALSVPQGAPQGTKIQYRIGNGSWRGYTSPFTLSNDAQHVVEHRLLRSNVVVDGSTAQVPIKIDKTAPATAIIRNPSGVVGTPRNPIDLTISATDRLSGVSSIEYRLNDGPWTASVDGRLTLDEVGEYVVSYRATDVAGVTSSAKSTTVMIAQDVAPTIRSSSARPLRGSVVTFGIAGLTRWADIVIVADGSVLATAITDVRGAARVSVRLPADISVGATEVLVIDETGVEARTTVTVR